MLICVCLRILASSRIPRYDLGRQNPSFLRWFCHIYAIIVEIVLPQPEMSPFMIMVDIASMTLLPSWTSSMTPTNAMAISSSISLELDEDIVRVCESGNELV
jgi:hypothetical protein